MPTNAYWLLVFSVMALALEPALGLFTLATGTHLSNGEIDIVTSLTLLGFAAAYLGGATGRVYTARGVGRTLQVLALPVAAGLTVVGYRFAIFLVTLYTTRT
jgi:hypothetical protein